MYQMDLYHLVHKRDITYIGNLTFLSLNKLQEYNFSPS